MQLVKPILRETARTARDGLTMAAGPRNGDAAPGLTFAQAFRPLAPATAVPGGPRLVTRNGQRVEPQAF